MSKKAKSKKSVKSSEIVPVRESFDWKLLLESDSHFTSAPVDLFKALKISTNWNQIITKDIKVEVHNPDAIQFSDDFNIKIEDCFWIASVINIQGFYIRLRYEGYEDDDFADFWKHIYDDDLKPGKIR